MAARTRGILLWLACLLLGAAPATLCAETRMAADLTPEAVWAAIDAARDGDVVQLPAGTAAWSKGWNSGHGAPMKAITIRGAGMDKTAILDHRAARSDTPFLLIGVEGKPFRVTGLTFDAKDWPDAGQAMLAVRGTCKDFRIDHCAFRNADHVLAIEGDTYGLVDHCLFEAEQTHGGNVQPVVLSGPGAPNYTKPLSLGTASAVYFEDNVVNLSPEVVNPTGNNPWIAPNNAARIVIRHNKIINSQLEIYRPGVMQGYYGCQSAEIYDNEFSAVDLKQGRPQGFIFIGGGVAIVFNNSVTGTTYNCRQLELRNERAWRDLPGFPKADGKVPMDGNQIPAGQLGAGYPCMGQVGWTVVDGKFTSSPCYAWNNTINGEPLPMEVSRRAEPNEAATIVEGRDFFNARPHTQYYTLYVYPHPLQREP